MLRQQVINFENLHQCKSNGSKQLFVRFPEVMGEQLNPEGQWLDLFSSQQFDTTDTEDYLYLRLFPDYTQENDVFGEGGLKNTFNSAAVYAHSTTRRGFKAIIRDKRLLILDIIRNLVNNSRSSSYTRYTPIKVIDFCLPEPEEEYTIRYGSIDFERLPGLRKNYLKEDWEFTFKEAKLRNL